MASEESANETPSLADVWKGLTEIKTNMEKLVLDVEFTKGQVDVLVKENKGLI